MPDAACFGFRSARVLTWPGATPLASNSSDTEAPMRRRLVTSSFVHNPQRLSERDSGPLGEFRGSYNKQCYLSTFLCEGLRLSIPPFPVKSNPPVADACPLGTVALPFSAHFSH